MDLPLELVRQTGPTVRLVDVRSGAETYLRTNPGDRELLRKLTSVGPGEAVELDWVLHESELRQFGAPVNVRAEIIIAREARRGGGAAPFRASFTLPLALD